MFYVYYPSWPLLLRVDQQYTRTGVMMMMLREYCRGEVGPITHSNSKGMMMDTCCCCHRHIRWAITKQPKPLQPRKTLHPTLNNTHTIFYVISQPSTIFSINYNNPNVSKFILFYSFISIYLSLLFCILFISSMTNIYHSASLYGSVCGPFSSSLVMWNISQALQALDDQCFLRRK